MRMIYERKKITKKYFHRLVNMFSENVIDRLSVWVDKTYIIALEHCDINPEHFPHVQRKFKSRIRYLAPKSVTFSIHCLCHKPKNLNVYRITTTPLLYSPKLKTF